MPACRSCSAPVRWLVTNYGKRIPVDPTPDPAGNLVVTGSTMTRQRSGGPLELVDVVQVEPPGMFPDDRPRYVPHFATCPNADEHRRR